MGCDEKDGREDGDGKEVGEMVVGLTVGVFKRRHGSSCQM